MTTLHPVIEGNQPICLEEVVSTEVLWEHGLSQDQGTREDQEDRTAFSYSINPETGQRFALAILADGLGGHEDGGEAAQTLVNAVSDSTISTILHNPDLMVNLAPRESEAYLTQAFIDANTTLNAKKGRRLDEPMDLAVDAGAAVTAALLVENSLILGHIGDTRAYLINQSGVVTQLTNDHSIHGVLQRSGQPVEGAINTLTRALQGNEEDVSGVEYTIHTLNETDQLLLCTDGLYNLLILAQIADIIRSASSLQEAATNLITAAKKRAAQQGLKNLDNLTALVLKHT